MMHQKYILGLDPGVGSVGWACVLVDEEGEPYRILDLGSRIFEPQGASMEERRLARGTRRVLRRRKGRVSKTRNLFVKYGYLTKEEVWNLHKNHPELSDPYRLRIKGKSELLTMEELAIVLVHYAKGRGFKSNRKAMEEKAKKDSDEQKMLAAKRKTEQKLADRQKEDPSYTLTNLLLDDFLIGGKIRNTAGNYQNGITRKMVEEEVNLILRKQEELGLINNNFSEEYLQILLFQRPFFAGPDEPSPYHDPLNKMVGFCTFERGERRAPRTSYSYELFTLVQKLTNIRYMIGNDYKNKRSLSAKEIQKLVQQAEAGKKITYKTVRSIINTDEKAEVHFIGISLQKEDKIEIGHLEKTNKLRRNLKKMLGKNYGLSTLTLDTISEGLTAYKSDSELGDFLEKKGLPKEIQDAVLQIDGKDFKGYGRVSLKFLNNILPLMIEQGLDYYSAAKECGYETTKRYENTEELEEVPVVEDVLERLEKSITNKAVIRTLVETRKVVNAIIRRYGKPERIHVEMARELTKSEDERKELQSQILSNQIAKSSLKEQIYSKFTDCFPSPESVSGADINQYKLFLEQDGICPYTLLQTGDMQKAKILEKELFTSDVEVDHIVPYSLCHDDRMVNKVLVKKETNQNKSNLLPLEYYRDPQGRGIYENYLKSNRKIDEDKKARLLASEMDERFITDYRARTINDTRYAAKALKEILTYSFPNIKVVSFNGQITAKLRGVWGLNGLTSSYENTKDYRKKPVANEEIEKMELLLGQMIQDGISRRSKDYQKIEEKIIDLKDKDKVKNRENHLHHAVDAAVLACATEKMRRRIEMHEMMLRQKKNETIHFELPKINEETGEVIEVEKFNITLNEYFTKYEKENITKKMHFPQPYYKFSEELKCRACEMNTDVLRTRLSFFPQYQHVDMSTVTPIFISHHYFSKLSGKMHEDTFYGVKEENKVRILTERMAVNSESFNEKKLEKIYDKENTQNYIYCTVKEWLGKNKNGAEAYKNHENQYPYNKNGNPIKKVKLNGGEVKEAFSIKTEMNQYVAKEDVVQVHIYQRENDEKLYFVGMDRFRVLNCDKRDDLALVLWYGQKNKRITLYPRELKANGFVKAPLILMKGQTILVEKTDGARGLCIFNGCTSGLFEVESILGDGNDLIGLNLFKNYQSQYRMTVSTIKSIKPVSVDVLGKIHSHVL